MSSQNETWRIEIDLHRLLTSFCCLVLVASTCVFAGLFEWAYLEWASGLPFDPDGACRLTYTDNATVTESEMREWAAREGFQVRTLDVRSVIPFFYGR